MKHLPLTLIYSRLLIGALLVALAWWHVPHFAALAVVLITLGLLTDVFDGIIARQLGISTEKLRRLDSTIDQAFWVMVLAATYLACPAFFAQNAAKLWALLALEGLTYAVSLLKFRKEVATHSWAAKAWVLVSFAALIQIITFCESRLLFEASFYVGVLSRLEIVAILVLLKQWANDVPTVYHAGLLRQNKPIRRYKLFNG
ncbi:CDP-alcohol phosphatidyltransferase family protein [Hymenobacter arizonensis]|uniref:CDP-diacylglycerol--glycerol-3-phosphate 3-phosphatidyltransferase n=1 Tax=Hymenobacter arizonensis TaxID=1227077 RepID=A0A1I5Z8X1_HYMAR|nr:CDP-alcohol phosphatidyltransferase family protein [Hymenobacter arizonensis]SFQ52825.1 CDP-diacylglycerol--glycerol-3-phosphate 3-phosphatidyltransferase [Hymenobacter arizonensis]